MFSIYKFSTITVKVVSAGEFDNRYALELSPPCSDSLFVPNAFLCASPLLFCWCLFYDRSFLRPKEEEMTYKC